MAAPEAAIAPSKKPRAKKKKAADEKLLPGAESAPQGDLHRPGKKTLRRLRYQQQQSSEIDFIVTSAEALKFTETVLIRKAPTASQGENESVLPSQLSIQTSSLSPRLSLAAAPPTTVKRISIQVQPLLILDLNGILCHRNRKSSDTYDPNAIYRPSIGHIAHTPIIPRPGLSDFLSLLRQHFTLAVWTSAKKKTAMKLIQMLLPADLSNRLLFVWAQHDCDLHLSGGAEDDKQDKALFEKDLTKVWKAYPLWNAHNTLLMDDSPEKCVAAKHNAIHPPPLHGQFQDASNLLQPLSDEENVAQQLVFLKQLAQHWADHPLLQEWDNEGGDVSFGTTKSQTEFLREHAGQYRGW
jgi:hypothetical protein